MIHHGDCIEVMRQMPDASVDAIVTDPPYLLQFMGKSWDGPVQMSGHSDPTLPEGHGGKAHDHGVAGHWRPHWMQQWHEAWGREALRVTVPGGYLLAFGGCRTHHRLVCGLEDAGWIIRDELTWVYASGFPKGRANLKPAHEPIVLARKPGPLRPLAIDECRIPSTGGGGDRDGEASADRRYNGKGGTDMAALPGPRGGDAAGRWPSNLLLSDPELFDEPNPYVVGSGATVASGNLRPQHIERHGHWAEREAWSPTKDYGGDSGGYSRFFIIPKADRVDREPVLGGLPLVDRPNGNKWTDQDYRTEWPDGADRSGSVHRKRANTHPTVKSTDLMRHLVRLVTPSGGTVLDPFLGSGSTAIACELEGFAWVGIEKEAEYVAIAEARLNGVQRGLGLDVPAPTPERKSVGMQGPWPAIEVTSPGYLFKKREKPEDAA